MAPVTFKVPGSSANLGPGFDCIGLALSIYLTITVIVSSDDPQTGEISTSNSTRVPDNCIIVYTGDSSSAISLSPSENLITKTALYVLSCHGHPCFPAPTQIHIDNQIPIGRGLGSSAAAVVAGVMIADQVASLNLSKARMLDYALMVERHPDNVAPALYGGLISGWLRELSKEVEEKVPHSEVLSGQATEMINGANGSRDSRSPKQPPIGICKCTHFNLSKRIKPVVIIPTNLEVPTAKARDVLPDSYSREAVVFNCQRIAALPTLLEAEESDREEIYSAMQDRIHQPYRAQLVPGLTKILESVTPDRYPGLCGICLSGAGPTILALATDGVEDIAKGVMEIFQNEGIESIWKVLEPAEGAVIVKE